ncbi:hypothetical protein [Streptomyces indicus]|uniref:Uncharacterized protein n=1 Tax=Streptomyces indicus TaxID=417292 RepID=A0A1G9J8D6_9ACTN|nr:hypothetical protein [Streptomyces indicus]SDL33493.1 hypothetical protein SAMN05421806_12832 [Streptomyces indicus]
MTVVLVVVAVWAVSCVPLGWWACRRDPAPLSRTRPEAPPRRR